jgi:hypothetical protein
MSAIILVITEYFSILAFKITIKESVGPKLTDILSLIKYSKINFIFPFYFFNVASRILKIISGSPYISIIMLF